MKFVKTKKGNLKLMKDKLGEALLAALAAKEVSAKTASCCDCSLDDLLCEIERQIKIIEDHVKNGLLKEDIIN